MILFFFFEKAEKQTSHQRTVQCTIERTGCDSAGAGRTTDLLPVKVSCNGTCNGTDKV